MITYKSFNYCVRSFLFLIFFNQIKRDKIDEYDGSFSEIMLDAKSPENLERNSPK